MTRTILVHLNVEAPDSDSRDVNAIADAILDSIGSEHDSIRTLEIVCPMAEEI